jgi:hypothetical protein
MLVSLGLWHVVFERCHFYVGDHLYGSSKLQIRSNYLFDSVPILTLSVVKLPITFIYERFVLSRQKQSAFVRQASPFEDFAVRCVRYAFANIPARIGRVFLSKPVALPFLRFRMLRHGYLRSPIHWHEVSLVGTI